MTRPLVRLPAIGARAVASAIFLSLAPGPSTVALGGASPTSSTIATDAYKVPDYTQAKLPAISSCDPKAKDDAIDGVASTGNTFLDAVTGTALKLNKAYNIKTDAGDDSDDGEEDVDGKATLDTDCEKLKTDGAADKLGIDPEKLQCGVVNAEGYIERMREAKKASNKYLACKRGVLDALRGEIGCFKKQIADAEGYMNELVNGQGGLGDMLKKGNEDLQQIDLEIQDRQAQLTAANERIDGGEGGNPPGLRQMAAAMKELSTKMVSGAKVASQATQDLQLQKTRFEGVLNQVAMGRAMKCMNTPVEGYRCVRKGTASDAYPTGSVSPVDYVKCIYAQSANKLVGGTAITDPKRESALKAEAKSAFDQAAAKAPTITDTPLYSNKAAWEATMASTSIKTPADLLKELSATLQDMNGATGKNVSAQFTADLNRCYAKAKAEIAAERTDSTSNTMASETALKRSFETKQAENGTAFHEFRDAYAQAVKAATGKSLSIDVSKCEAGSLDDQAKCFDAMRVMADAIYTGRVTPPAAALSGPALALTNGQDPIHGFSSVLTAKNVPNRSIAVTCSGLDDCVTKYTNYRTALKANVDERTKFKETYKSQLNVKILTTASDLAAKGTTGAGAAGIQAGGITLNSVAANVERRKNQLATVMSKFGVEAGLDLDPKEIKEPSKGDDGLYKASDLSNLVLSAIKPSLPDTNSKGFSEATKSIGEKDDKLVKLQDALDTDMNALESKVAECKKDKKKVACDRATEFWNKCKEDSKNDQFSKLIDTWTTQINTTDDEKKKADLTAKMEAKVKEHDKAIGEKNENTAPGSTALNCAAAPAAYQKACPFEDAVTDNNDKGNQATGTNRDNGLNSGQSQ